MIIGILGKGGSGKSTVATNLVRALMTQKENNVLAIDADHNMDLTYNLGVTEEFPYLGSSMSDLKVISGLDSDENYRLALTNNKQGLFTLSPKDTFTKKYTNKISDNLSLMTAGPQTDDVISDKACSHALFTSLKVYLPLLSLKENEWVIVDEKAGADGVSTGIPTGFDVAIIVSEPTVHGIKTARQIAGLLNYFDVPYEFVINKVMDHHANTNFIEELGKSPIDTIGFDQSFSAFDGSNTKSIVECLNRKKTLLVGKRYERSKNKFTRQDK
jgi:CO dehydrogenase maturation factor